jgi:hypothetical protein
VPSWLDESWRVFAIFAVLAVRFLGTFKLLTAASPCSLVAFAVEGMVDRVNLWMDTLEDAG